MKQLIRNVWNATGSEVCINIYYEPTNNFKIQIYHWINYKERIDIEYNEGFFIYEQDFTDHNFFFRDMKRRIMEKCNDASLSSEKLLFAYDCIKEHELIMQKEDYVKLWGV